MSEQPKPSKRRNKARDLETSKVFLETARTLGAKTKEDQTRILAALCIFLDVEREVSARIRGRWSFR